MTIKKIYFKKFLPNIVPKIFPYSKGPINTKNLNIDKILASLW